MESQIATFEDATLILKLYELRQEPVLRKARHWLIFEFNPRTVEELLGVARGYGTEENAFYRQVTSFWEMAASLVLHGAVNGDLFLDSNGEGIYIFSKFHALKEDFQAKTGRPLMPKTAQLIEKFPVARDLFTAMLKSVQARKS